MTFESLMRTTIRDDDDAFLYGETATVGGRAEAAVTSGETALTTVGGPLMGLHLGVSRLLKCHCNVDLCPPCVRVISATVSTAWADELDLAVTLLTGYRSMQSLRPTL